MRLDSAVFLAFILLTGICLSVGVALIVVDRKKGKKRKKTRLAGALLVLAGVFTVVTVEYCSWPSPEPDERSAPQIANARVERKSIQGTSVDPQIHNSNGLPAESLTYAEEIVVPVTAQGPPKKIMKVHVKTTRTITAAVIGVVFSAPLAMTREYPGANGAELRDTPIQNVEVKLPITLNGVTIPNSIEAVINNPGSFKPGQDLVFTVISKNDAHVSRVIQLPY